MGKDTLNIASAFLSAEQVDPEKIGIVEAKTERVYSFAQLKKKANQYAWFLKDAGVKPGDRVMLMVTPSADFICLTFALFMVGAPVILIDPGMGYKNLLRCVDSVKPKIFIGVPKARIFVELFRSYFSSLSLKMCCGNGLGMLGPNIKANASDYPSEAFPFYRPRMTDLAAIIFTTGSTGPPKGVRYEHDIFSAQLNHISTYYGIGAQDIDQPAFPLFGLFSICLGATVVIPDMDATKPAQVDPVKFVHSIQKWRVSYSFGSPALWNVVSNYCLKYSIRLSSVKKVLMAGAPVPGELIERVQKIISDEASVHTPYGATESLPIVSIEGHEITKKTWEKTQSGCGTCVGRPLPGIKIAVISMSDEIIEELDPTMLLDRFEIGEIIVKGDVVTRGYDNNKEENKRSKINENGQIWHRMGDVGYIDDEQRLWFCGRKAHSIQASEGKCIQYPVRQSSIITQIYCAVHWLGYQKLMVLKDLLLFSKKTKSVAGRTGKF